MAITQTTYTGNGSTTNYSFTFEYLKQADVKVTLDTVATTAFTFANATTLAFTTAPASGVAIRIFRDTAIDNLSATFFPGSAIKAEDLNENFTQNLYVTQESDFEVDTANTTANTAKTTADTALTNSTTAISTANSATTTANTAITTSNSATTTANAATTTANTASTNASSAVTTANTASTNATAAVNTANTASTNASAAVTTANSAQADATTAISTANSATATANSATTTANSAVTTANTANTNATAAQTAATTAQASATAAQTSATAAQTSATAAQAQATLAADVRNAFTVTDSNSDGTFDFVVGDIPIKGNAGVKLPFESVTYAEEGAIRYNNSLDKIELYNGAGQWVTAGGGASVSSTPPTLPSAGDVWYDHDNGRAYVYYNDGDSNQWVEMNPSWNGYVADNSVTSAKIVDGTIVNADVNASAAIALSKLATGALPSAITVASSNIVDGTIVNADVNASAAIAQSKLALDITNSEVNASAAVAGTKISPDFGSQNVLTTGSVGIGTASPFNTGTNYGSLDIAGTDGGEISLSDGGTAKGRLFNYATNSDLIGLAAKATAGQLVFSTGGDAASDEAMRIDSSGNVKIGTGADRTSLLTASTANLQVDGGIVFEPGSGNDAEIFNYRGTSMKFGTSGAERLRIDSSGNVGIGTTSPAANAKLDVNGSVNISPNTAGKETFRFATNAVDDGRLLIKSNTTTKVDIQANGASYFNGGNVGIGTTSPSHGLLTLSQSASSAFNALVIQQGNTGSAATDGLHIGIDSAVDAYIMHKESRALAFGTANTERLRIDSSGTVEVLTNQFTVGTHGTTGLQFISDGTFGTLQSADLKFRTASTERMRIDSSGNVGIGTTSPGALLTVGSTSRFEFDNTNNYIHAYTSNYYIYGIRNASNSLELDSPFGGNIIFRAQNLGTASSPGTATERMRIDSSGRVGIGTSSPESNAQATIYEASGNTPLYLKANNANSYLYFEDSGTASFKVAIGASSNQMRLITDGTERVRIDSTGKTILLGTSTNGALVVETTQGAASNKNLIVGGHSASSIDGGTGCFVVLSNGNVVNTNNSYGALSDVKLKENIVDASSQWDDIKAVQVRNYNLKESTGQQTHTQLGVVAQEVELVSPGLVSESPDLDADGNDLGTVTKSVNYSVLYMKAVKALQEAIAKIETLETQNASLEARLTALEGA